MYDGILFFNKYVYYQCYTDSSKRPPFGRGIISKAITLIHSFILSYRRAYIINAIQTVPRDPPFGRGIYKAITLIQSFIFIDEHAVST